MFHEYHQHSHFLYKLTETPTDVPHKTVLSGNPSLTSPDMIPPTTKEKSTYWNKEKVATSLPPKISDAVQETSVSGTKNDGMSNTMPSPTPKTSNIELYVSKDGSHYTQIGAYLSYSRSEIKQAFHYLVSVY